MVERLGQQHSSSCHDEAVTNWVLTCAVDEGLMCLQGGGGGGGGGGDSNDPTCAVNQVICIPSHAKLCGCPSLWSMAVYMSHGMRKPPMQKQR